MIVTDNSWTQTGKKWQKTSREVMTKQRRFTAYNQNESKNSNNSKKNNNNEKNKNHDKNAQGKKVTRDQMHEFIDAFVEKIDKNTIAAIAFMGKLPKFGRQRTLCALSAARAVQDTARSTTASTTSSRRTFPSTQKLTPGTRRS